MKLKTLREYLELSESLYRDPEAKHWATAQSKKSGYRHPLVDDAGDPLKSAVFTKQVITFPTGTVMSIDRIKSAFDDCAEDEIPCGVIKVEHNKQSANSYNLKLIVDTESNTERHLKRLFKQYDFVLGVEFAAIDYTQLESYKELSKKCKSVKAFDSKIEFMIDADTAIIVMMNGYVRLKNGDDLRMLDKPATNDKLENALKFALQYANRKYFK